MDQNQLIDTIKQLIVIPSVSGNAVGLRQALDFVAGFITEHCPDATIEYFEDEGISSLLAYKSGQRPDKFHVLLNGHIDVVPGKSELFEPHIKDGKLYGRGVYDMKAAALVLTEVFCEFVNKVPYPLGLQIVTDEEISGYHGTQYQIKQGVRSDFVICGECGRLEHASEIANQAKGIIHATIGFSGNSAHGAYPWKGTNAALKAARFATRLYERYPTPPAETGETTITLTSIVTSHDAHNKVPDSATATIDARYTAGDTHFATTTHFEALLHDIDPEVEVISYSDVSKPVYSDPANPLLQALKAAAEQVERKPFNLVTRCATSDARHLAQVGSEGCEFGLPGDFQHGDDEFVPVQAIFDYREVMRNFLSRTLEP